MMLHKFKSHLVFMSSICSHCKNNTLSLQYLAPVAIFFMIFLFHFAFLVMCLPLFGADAPSFPESDVAEVAFAVFRFATPFAFFHSLFLFPSLVALVHSLCPFPRKVLRTIGPQTPRHTDGWTPTTMASLLQGTKMVVPVSVWLRPIPATMASLFQGTKMVVSISLRLRPMPSLISAACLNQPDLKLQPIVIIM